MSTENTENTENTAPADGPLLSAARLGATVEFATNSGGGVWVKATAPSGESASEIAKPDEASIAAALGRAVGRVAAAIKAGT